jgi:hypothetical protein
MTRSTLNPSFNRNARQCLDLFPLEFFPGNLYACVRLRSLKKI